MGQPEVTAPFPVLAHPLAQAVR